MFMFVLLLGSESDGCNIPDLCTDCQQLKRDCYELCRTSEYSGQDNAACKAYCRGVVAKCNPCV